MGGARLRILTFNWHEAYVSMLAETGHRFDVLQRTKAGLWFWLHTTRNVPDNVSLVHPEDVRRRLRHGVYDLAICHTYADLDEIHEFDVPAVLTFHNYRQTEVELSRARNERHPSDDPSFFEKIRRRARVVFISEAKKKSWGIPGDVILPGIDPDLFDGYRGEELRALRVGNFLLERDLMMGGAIQQIALRGIPHTTLGLNSQIPGAGLSPSFDALRDAYRSHRVFLHTTRPGYEDGYNLALLEAMCTGMPPVTLRHETSPIEDGVSGLVADDAAGLRSSLLQLFEDVESAKRLGRAARAVAAEEFPATRFREKWEALFEDVVGKRPRRGSRRSVSSNDEGVQRERRRKRVLLLYTAYPATTARYIERALRERHLVVTAGPTIPPEQWKKWNLEKLREPARPQDISVNEDTTLEQIWQRLPPGFEPDAVVWIETGLGFFPKDITQAPVSKLAYLIDTHFHLDWHREWAERFDHVFLAQKAYVSNFTRAGVSASWLPLACDPEIHRPGSYREEFDIGFVGSLVEPRRVRLLKGLQEKFSTFVHRLFLEETAEAFPRARIVWNSAARGELNMRVFEALSTGSFLLTERVPESGQDELFQEGRHLAVYDDENLHERVEYFLARPEERRAIAERGREEVLSRHTYRHRVERIVAEIERLSLRSSVDEAGAVLASP